jgi:hypothetical protein
VMSSTGRLRIQLRVSLLAHQEGVATFRECRGCDGSRQALGLMIRSMDKE